VNRRRRMEGPITVATDGGAGAMGALHLASALSKRGAGPVLVLAVLEPMTMIDFVSPKEVESLRLLERSGVERLREAVNAQLRDLNAETSAWEVRVVVGSPSAVITDSAHDFGSALLLLGIGRHAPADRWLGSETALRVIQLSSVPVLAVDPEARSLPRVALVAEDLGELSREAGTLARDLLVPGGDLHLAHTVAVPIDSGIALPPYDWMGRYLEEVHGQMEARRQAIATRDGIAVETHVLLGSAVAEILRLAEETGADLIAAGSHGRGFMGRLLLGSVSTALVRRAKCSVLVVPSRPGDDTPPTG
jgi:nucleotide-binding universal stress UspA family protein